MKPKKKLPDFSKMSRKEEAEFWDTHDATEFDEDEFEEGGVLEVAPHIKNPRDLSPRCPKDDKILLTRYVDVEIANGRLILRHVPELYCREGHFTMLPAEIEKDIRVHEAVNEALHEPEARKSSPKRKAKLPSARSMIPERTKA